MLGGVGEGLHVARPLYVMEDLGTSRYGFVSAMRGGLRGAGVGWSVHL